MHVRPNHYSNASAASPSQTWVSVSPSQAPLEKQLQRLTLQRETSGVHSGSSSIPTTAAGTGLAHQLIRARAAGLVECPRCGASKDCKCPSPTTDAAVEALRQALLAKMPFPIASTNGHHHQRTNDKDSMDFKYFSFTQGYTAIPFTSPIVSPSACLLNMTNISQGTQINNRDGLKIKIHGLILNYMIWNNPAAISSTSQPEAMWARVVVFIDRIPAVPGTSPVVWTVGASPFVTDSVFDAQGITAASDGMISVPPNPLTSNKYRICYDKVHNLTATSTFNTTVAGVPTPLGVAGQMQVIERTFVPLHGLECSFLQGGAANPITNAVWVWVGVSDSTGTGQTPGAQITCLNQFKDVPAAI